MINYTQTKEYMRLRYLVEITQEARIDKADIVKLKRAPSEKKTLRLEDGNFHEYDVDKYYVTCFSCGNEFTVDYFRLTHLGRVCEFCEVKFKEEVDTLWQKLSDEVANDEEYINLTNRNNRVEFLKNNFAELFTITFVEESIYVRRSISSLLDEIKWKIVKNPKVKYVKKESDFQSYIEKKLREKGHILTWRGHLHTLHSKYAYINPDIVSFHEGVLYIMELKVIPTAHEVARGIGQAVFYKINLFGETKITILPKEKNNDLDFLPDDFRLGDCTNGDKRLKTYPVREVVFALVYPEKNKAEFRDAVFATKNELFSNFLACIPKEGIIEHFSKELEKICGVKLLFM